MFHLSEKEAHIWIWHSKTDNFLGFFIKQRKVFWDIRYLNQVVFKIPKESYFFNTFSPRISK